MKRKYPLFLGISNFETRTDVGIPTSTMGPAKYLGVSDTLNCQPSIAKSGSLQSSPDPSNERKYEPDATFNKIPQQGDIKTERHFDSYMSQRRSPSQSLQPNTIPHSSNAMSLVSGAWDILPMVHLMKKYWSRKSALVAM